MKTCNFFEAIDDIKFSLYYLLSNKCDLWQKRKEEKRSKCDFMNIRCLVKDLSHLKFLRKVYRFYYSSALRLNGIFQNDLLIIC